MDNPLAWHHYIIPFGIAFGSALVLSYGVRRFALRRGIVDHPSQAPERKIHRRPVPLIGGIAIFGALIFTTGVYAFFSDRLFGGYLLPKHLIGIGIAGVFLMIGGALDDLHNRKPVQQIIWPILAALAVISVGIGITYITNPLGGVIQLDTVSIELFSWNSTPYVLTLFADIFAFCWLMGMMYTTKFLDGLDGLVAGITTIGAFVLFFLSLNQEVAQPETALLSVILAGSMAGFLILNFHPAKIFLGEGGSLLAGFMLGVLAILSGAKIATALLIMGIPILDVVWVIIRRAFFEKQSPFRTADKKHLHFRLLDIGLSHRQAVLLLYGISLLFGGIALFSGGREKLTLLIVAGIVMAVLGTITIVLKRRQRTHS